MQVFSKRNRFVFEILTDDEVKTTSIASESSIIFEVNIHDYCNHEIEI